jgi:hypothetical protein
MNLFKGDELFTLGAIETILKKSRDTMLLWINNGILVKTIKSGQVVRCRLRLTARKIGNTYMVYGSDINSFLDSINRNRGASS